MDERRKHPSGRAIHRRQYRGLPITRRPPDEPLTPGLRRDRQTFAIGFHARLTADEDDE